MDLDRYLWENHIKHGDFANKVEISGSTLSQIVTKRRSPRLVTAVKIIQESKGEVTFIELLCPRDRVTILERAKNIAENGNSETGGKE